MGGHFLSARSWFVFAGAEFIVAGVLIVLGAFSGWALITAGVVILSALWGWERYAPSYQLGVRIGVLLNTLFVVIGWSIAGARGELEVIGYNSARQGKLFEWLLSIPWWAVLGFALISTLWLIWVSWPRPKSAPLALKTLRLEEGLETREIASDADDIVTTYREGAETDLMKFFINYILPAVLAQKDLQEALIGSSCEDRVLRKCAVRGIIATPGGISEFWQSVSALWGAFGSSPVEYVPMETMIDHISKIERNYKTFVEQADEVARGVDYKRDPRFKTYWENWRNKHDSLREQYDATIKQDPRFKTLFRPARESRWGTAFR